MCTQCTLHVHSSFVQIFCCFYLYNVHIQESTFDIFDKPFYRYTITRAYKCRNTRTNSFFPVDNIILRLWLTRFKTYRLQCFSQYIWNWTGLGSWNWNRMSRKKKYRLSSPGFANETPPHPPILDKDIVQKDMKISLK